MHATSKLVHVKGTFHRPDGLSYQLLQPSNPKPNDSDNEVFEDWINRMHGFMHHVQLPITLAQSASIAPCLPPFAHYSLTLMTFDNNSIHFNKVSPPPSTNPLFYNNVPRSPKAVAGNKQV